MVLSAYMSQGISSTINPWEYSVGHDMWHHLGGWKGDLEVFTPGMVLLDVSGDIPWVSSPQHPKDNLEDSTKVFQLLQCSALPSWSWNSRHNINFAFSFLLPPPPPPPPHPHPHPHLYPSPYLYPSSPWISMSHLLQGQDLSDLHSILLIWVVPITVDFSVYWPYILSYPHFFLTAGQTLSPVLESSWVVLYIHIRIK